MDHMAVDKINQMMKMVPQLAALDVDVIEVGDARAKMRLPWSDDLVGYKDTGILAGGAVFTLLDSVLGTAVFSALDKLMPVATLDLRVDYLRPATSGRDVFASAHCYRVTKTIAFVRGIAFHDHEDEAIAHASASFVLNRGPEKERTS